MHWRAFRARLTKSNKESPLLAWVLAAFILGYLLFGFWLFKSGLEYLYTCPLVGSLLAERILIVLQLRTPPVDQAPVQIRGDGRAGLRRIRPLPGIGPEIVEDAAAALSVADQLESRAQHAELRLQH